MGRFLISMAAVAAVLLTFAAAGMADNDVSIFDLPDVNNNNVDAKKSEPPPTVAIPSTTPTTPTQDDVLAKISEIKKIEQIHDRVVADADSTRVAEYRKFLERIKKGGDIEKVVAVQARLKQLEDELENPKKGNAPRLRILSATYGTILYGINDVTEILRKKVNAKGSVQIIVSDNEFAGNFEPGNKRENYMIVRYSVSGGPVKLAVRQTGQQLVLP